MKAYQKEFIDFVLAKEVLKFGTFELNSGRMSPYFFNLGLLFSGAALLELGRFYARTLQASGLQVDCLFGPAYKGIPLAVTLGQALASTDGPDLPCLFNRKETKQHGEGGRLVGQASPGQRCLIVDDVLTAGTAVRECLPLLRAAELEVAGVIVALDRQERAHPEMPESATAQLEKEGLSVIRIVKVTDVIDYLGTQDSTDTRGRRMLAYWEQYGAPE